MPISLGRWIRNRRLAEGMTQKALAEKINAYEPQISGWENNKHSPSAEYKVKLERLFGPLPGKNAKNDGDNIREADNNLIGSWVREQRERLDLTVQELATKSGLTTPTIYAIEQGRTRNPQEATRKKLEDALNISIPTEISNEVKEASTVAGIGELKDFNPHSPEELPSLPGVYVLYDGADRPAYIGKSKNIARRLKQHKKDRKWFEEPIVSTAAFIEIDNAELRSQVESIMIKFLRKNALLNNYLKWDGDEGGD